MNGLQQDRRHDELTSCPAAWRITVVLALAGLLTSMAQTALVPLVPLLPRLLDTSPSRVAWAVTASLVAGAVSNPITGRLGDMLGKRSALLGSLVSLFVGSVLCAVGDSLPVVLAGRAAQGCALGAIPLGISIVKETLPAARIGTATAVLSSMVGVGSALALPGSALLIRCAPWHLLYWVFAAASVAALLLVAAVIPRFPVPSPTAPMDAGGAVGLVVGATGLLLALSEGGAWGWTSPRVAGLFALSAVVLAWWGRWEWHRPHPLIDLRASAGRRVLVTNVSAVLVGFATYALVYSTSQLLCLPRSTHYGFGLSTLTASLCLTPSGLVMLLSSPLASWLSIRFGARTTLVTGSAIVATGWLLGLLIMHAVWQLVTVSCVIGAGVGLAYAAMPMLVMDGVPAARTASAIGVNTLMRSLGTSASGAVLGMILTSRVTTLHGTEMPSHSAFRNVFLCALFASTFAAATALLLPARGHMGTGPAIGTRTVPAATSMDAADPFGKTRDRRSRAADRGEAPHCQGATSDMKSTTDKGNCLEHDNR
ncbi:MFS transporter [Streptomyces sp. NPDC046977]|uniref:MFS transporter n=1 Tax=Streptomyces sp. NPDC046977 TaxID=3154703 RepID=UPI0033E01A46